MSMEEEKARQEKMNQGSSGSPQKPVASGAMEEDPELAAALAMSMGQDPSGDVPMMTEDEELAKALAMSMENVFIFDIEYSD